MGNVYIVTHGVGIIIIWQQIVFVNDDNNGKILYSLGTDYSRIDNCEGEILRDKSK